VKEFTLKISIPKDIKDFNSFEEWALRKGRDLSKALLSYWCENKDEELMSARPKGVRKERKESRYLHTRFGTVNIKRWKVSKKKEGKRRRYFYPLDIEIGLEKRRGVSLGLRKRGIEEVCEYSYRKGSKRLEKETGERVSHGRLHRWVQEEGKKIKDQEDRQIEEVFNQGKEIKVNKKEEIVVIEADATGISSKEGKGRWFGVKVGIIYSGKEDKGKNGKSRRFQLLNKRYVASIIGGVEEFGNKLYYEAQSNFGVDEARIVLYQSDGDNWLKDLKNIHFPRAYHQVDLWHIKERIDEVVKGMEDRKILKEFLYRKQINELLMKLYELSFSSSSIERKRYAQLIAYIWDNRKEILAFQDLIGKLNEPYKNLAVSGCGAIEKNIEILIGRRFKKQGMSWTKEGADYLLRLRVLKTKPNLWKRYWLTRTIK
jgi:hypothetical protein